MSLPGIYRADYVQFGAQATFDSPVAATFKYPGELTFTEQQTNYEPQYPLHIRGLIAGQMVPIMKGAAIVYKSELTCEEAILFLAAGLQGGVSPTTANVTEKTWTFEATPDSDPTPEYISAEFAVSNWDSIWGRLVGNVLVSKLDLQFAANKEAMLTATMFGGAVAAGDPTTSLSNITGREILTSNKLGVWIDDSAAGLGTTQFTGENMSVDISLEGGLKPDFTLDARANLDYAKYLALDVAATIKIEMQYGADAQAEFAKFRARTPRFIRAKVTGSTIASNPRYIQVDLCGEYVKEPTIANKNGIRTATFELKGKYDPTWGHFLLAKDMCAIGSLS